MQNKVITISRQYGSGGRQIGARLAQRLNLPLYDREMIALAAERSGISDDLFEEVEQRDYLFRDLLPGIAAEPPLCDKVYLAQRAVIHSLAAKGPCVMVGRGAGGVLKDVVPLLNVFLYADIELRARRAVEEYGDAPHKIKEHIEAIDKKRAAYFKFYAGRNGRQMEQYHLCIDSGFMGIEHTAAILEAAYLLEGKK